MTSRPCSRHRTSFAATLHIELANALLAFNKLEEAERQYCRAADLLNDSPLPATAAMEKAVECSIRRHCLEKTLEHILEIITIVGSIQGKVVALQPPFDYLADMAAGAASGSYRALLAQCEITAVLVLLLVPEAVRKTHTLVPTLKRYVVFLPPLPKPPSFF